MKKISKNTLFFYKEKLFNLVKSFGFYAIKLEILSVSYFSQTKYYVFYVLFVILPGHLKGLIPFFIFLLTFTTLGLIETVSINLRVSEYVQVCETIYNDLESFRKVPLTIPNIVEFEKILIEITETPEEIPSTGILTDVSRWIIKKFSLV